MKLKKPTKKNLLTSVEEAEKAISESSKETELANNQITKARNEAEEAQNLEKQLRNSAKQEKIRETLRANYDKFKTVTKIHLECEYCGEKFSNEKKSVEGAEPLLSHL